jgi:hypothetical protein
MQSQPDVWLGRAPAVDPGTTPSRKSTSGRLGRVREQGRSGLGRGRHPNPHRRADRVDAKAMAAHLAEEAPALPPASSSPGDLT